jgi:proteasome component ECM29
VGQRSAAVRRDYATAIGTLVRVSPLDVCELVLARCRKLLVARESDEAVETSAVIGRALSQRAPDVIRTVGAQVLPLAFVGMYDSSEVVAGLWKEVWEDHAAGTQVCWS